MADERPPYHDNDTAPFASVTHILTSDGPTQEANLDVRDTDVILQIGVDASTTHVLHLYNVRTDTIAAAQPVVEEFLDHLKKIHDGNSSQPGPDGHTITENFDQAHMEIVDYIKAQAEKRGLLFEWTTGSWPRATLRRSRSQPKYHVYFKDGQCRDTFGNRAVPSWQDRVLPAKE